MKSLNIRSYAAEARNVQAQARGGKAELFRGSAGLLPPGAGQGGYQASEQVRPACLNAAFFNAVLALS
jgi:hypothetical protein